MLRKRIKVATGRFLKKVFLQPSKVIPLRYGVLISVFGKWKITTKGILFERTSFGECDYFIDNRMLADTTYLKLELDRLVRFGWLDEVDCYHFVSAWFEKVTSQEEDNYNIQTSIQLGDFQKYLSRKFILTN